MNISSPTKWKTIIDGKIKEIKTEVRVTCSHFICRLTLICLWKEFFYLLSQNRNPKLIPNMIKNRKLIIMGLLSFLFHCTSIKVNDIKIGKFLDKAEVSTIDSFFQNRMKNSIKKVIGRNWEILYETNEFVYFGFPKGSSFDDLYVEELFRVDKPSLVKEFPGYKELTGIEINRTAYNSVPMKSMHESTLIQDFKKTFHLKESGIEIDLVWTYSTDGAPQKSKRFLILIDKTNGKILNYKEIGF